MRSLGSVILFSALAGVVAGATLLLPAEGSAPRPRDVARLLPGDAVLHVVIDGAPWFRHAGDLALAALLEEPAVSRFLAPVVAARTPPWDGLRAAARAYLGLELEEAVALLRYRLSATLRGMIPSCAPRPRIVPDLVVTLEFDSELAMVRRLLDALEKAVLAWGSGTFEDAVMAGLPVRHYVPRSMAGIEAWYFVQGSLLVLGTGESTMEGVVTRLKSGDDAGSLAREPAFVRAAGTVRGADALAYVYADARRLGDVLRDVLPARWSAALAASGLDDGPFEIGYGLEPDAGGMRERVLLRLPPAALQKLPPPGAGVALAQAVPAKAGFAATLSLDGPLAAEAAIAACDVVSPGALGSLEQEVLGPAGLDLRGELSGLIGPGLALFAAWPEHGLLPDLGIVVSARRPDAASRFLEKVASTLEGRVREGAAAGRRLWWWDPPGSFLRGLTSPRPAWALDGDHILVTAWPGAARRLLASGATDASPSRARSERHMAPPGAGTAGRLWLDLPDLVRFLGEDGRPLARMLASSLAGWDAGVDWDAVPDPEIFARHLEGVAADVTCTATGVRLEVWSTTSLGMPAACVALAAAARGWSGSSGAEATNGGSHR